jgi:hypothetical protein
MARSAVSAVLGEEISYSPSFLSSVERLIDRLSKHQVEDVAETLFCLGCYVGEVIVRNIGGQWVRPEDVEMGPYSRFPLVLMMPSGHVWNPIGKTFKRFEMGSSESIAHLYEAALSAAR